MWAEILLELRGRGAGVVVGMLLGMLFTAIVAVLKRRAERRNVMLGDARDTVVIAQHIVETDERGAAAPQSCQIADSVVGAGTA
jgi:hypothetical protein